MGFGLCLLCCGTRKRIHNIIHNIDNCGLGFVCLVCCGTRKRIHHIDMCNNRFRSGLCFGLICGTILMMDLIVFVV